MQFRSMPEQAVYERAWLFRREFGYGFVQWYENGSQQGQDKVCPFLFVDNGEMISGACAFHWIDQRFVRGRLGDSGTAKRPCRCATRLVDELGLAGAAVSKVRHP
jgi:hypothetical protein